MRKIFTFLLFALWLPAMVLAAAPSGQVIYVGDETVTSGGYWTTDENGNITAYSGEGTPTDNYIHFDATNNTLTLHNATIKESVPSNTSTYVMGAGIGVFNQSGNATLTIQLEGTNTIAEVSTGICVLAFSNSTGDASLTITGSGSLDASGSYNPAIIVQSNGGNATLSIENAKVTATASSSGNGVLVQSKNDSSVSLTVDGGSLTATGSGNYGAGIQLLFGSGDSGSGTPTVTVSNNAIVRANGGIVDNSSTDIQIGADSSESTGGIVFDGGEGTVYGSVTLQEDLEIGEGESLTIPDGSSLNISDGKTLTVNGGELKGENIPTEGVVYKVTEVTLSPSTLSLDVDKSSTLTATITPDNATDKSVTWTSEDEDIATVENGKVTAVGTGSTTIKATVDGKSASCEVTVAAISKQTPTVDDFIFTAPEDWTYGDEGKSVTVEAKAGVTGMGEITISYWQEGNQVETPTDAGTYTVKVCVAEGDNYAAAELADETWTFEIKKATLPDDFLTIDKTEASVELDGTATPTTLTATVTGYDLGDNPKWEWVSNNPNVATVKASADAPSIQARATETRTNEAIVTALGVGSATITATYTDSHYTGTVTFELTVTEKEEPDPETPVIPDYPSYYNIYVEECEGVTAEVSSEVVREGTSITLTVEVTEGYTVDGLTVKVKRSIFGNTEDVKPDSAGVYTIRNIYTDLYITISGVTEEEQPTGIEELTRAKVYTQEGSLYMETPQRATVRIISMTGTVVEQSEQIGKKRYDLPRGIYIIGIDEERYKVRI